MILTGEQLKKIAPMLTIGTADTYAAHYNRICPMYGINNADIFCEYIANVIHESGGLTTFVENLNYKATSLVAKFGRHRISIADCYKYGRTAEHPADRVAIANTLYGGQWGKTNLGNTLDGDGWKFRGSGEMQLTGRYLITKFTSHYNILEPETLYTPEEVTEKLRTDKAVSTHASCWLFVVEKKLIDEAIADDDLKIRKSINGGTFGLDEVLRLTNLAEQILQ